MEEFKTRRAKLAALLHNDSIAILKGADIQFRNSDTESLFRQDSDFYYLSGFAEPNSILILCKDSKGKLSYILFNNARDPDAEVWTGKRVGQEGACQEYAADEAYDINTIDSRMPKLLANKHIIYSFFAAKPEFNQQILSWVQVLKHNSYRRVVVQDPPILNIPDTMIDLAPLLHELRLFKSPQEIEYMRRAANISAAAHMQVMQQCKPGQMEYQLDAIFTAHCMNEGCTRLAYNTIAAGGNNGCTLHYTVNDQKLQNGDLVLVDAGGEYKYYAADITRTFPINGKFTPEQRQIYNLVLQAQLAGIAQVKPGNKWADVQDATLKIIVAGLVELGILTGPVDQLIKDQAHKKFYMHGVGHWLGMDVHDVGAYKQNGSHRAFEPGMVLTVEPGIYIERNSSDVDPKWWGIAVRIEDDVLVTTQGPDVLSSKAPKQIDEIERAAV